MLFCIEIYYDFCNLRLLYKASWYGWELANNDIIQLVHLLRAIEIVNAIKV